MSEEQNRILKQQLWNIANELRGNMGADELETTFSVLSSTNTYQKKALWQ